MVILSGLQGGYLTLRCLVRSFTHVVLNSFGSKDWYGVAFEIVYWVLSLGFAFLVTTVHLIANKYASSNDIYVRQFVSDGISPHHIQTKEIKLDGSKVPAEVKVHDLLDFLQKINFEHSENLGYMRSTSRQEDGITLTTDDLRVGLETFVRHVDGHIPFLGTPRAHEIFRLDAFYQQIEDAVRLSIHKIKTDFTEFFEKYPDPNSSEESQKKYNNLLENRARLAIDLAIAGRHCGARYVSESMSSYFGFYGSAEPSGTLEDSLFELLAAKRNQVALGEIGRYFGVDPHGFNQYMQQMGDFLAIPGTENVIESLSGNFNLKKYLRSFFIIYNEDFIIDSVQEKIRESQAFREQIMEWFKLQVGDWTAEQIDAHAFEVRIQEVIDGKFDISEWEKDILFFQEILKLQENTVHSLEEKIPFPELGESWSDFISDVFTLNETKSLFFKTDHLLDKSNLMRRRRKVSRLLIESPIGKALEKQYREKKTILLDISNKELLLRMVKLEKMRAILPIQEESFFRVLEGKADLTQVICDFIEIDLETRFLKALDIGNMKENGLRPLLLEWLLDSHRVFVPKNIERVALPNQPLTNPGSYIHVIDEDSSFLSDLLPREKSACGRNKRYVFNETEKTCSRVFKDKFATDPEEVIRAARDTLPMDLRVYPRWKEIVYIRTPEIMSSILGHEVIQVVCCAISTFVIIRLSGRLYGQSSILVDRLLRRYRTSALPGVVTNALPGVARKSYRLACKAYQWFVNHKLEAFSYACTTRFVLESISYPLARRVVGRIHPWSIMISGTNYFKTTWKMIVHLYFFVRNILSRLSATLQFHAECSKQERLTLYEKHCYAIWKKALDD